MMLIGLFWFVFFSFKFFCLFPFPGGRLSWLLVSFLLHVKYARSYRINQSINIYLQQSGEKKRSEEKTISIIKTQRIIRIHPHSIFVSEAEKGERGERNRIPTV